MSAIRPLAWAIAVLFVIATILQLADQLNLFFTPPALPDSLNLVQRVLGNIDYRHNIWPIFFAANLLIGLGFGLLSCLGPVLAGRADRDDRRAILAATFIGAGLLGAAGQLVLIGSIKTSIDIPYCDCGFKDQEIVSQVWALMVTQGASEWLVNGAVLFAAAGIAVAGLVFGGSRLSSGWRTYSWVLSGVLLFALVFGFSSLSPDVTNALVLLSTGVLIPIWALWLGQEFAHSSPADT
jgi:hypothetical protein